MMDWLSDTLVMTTLLMLLVLFIRKPVAAQFGPSVAYWLWLLPAARLFMPSLEKTIQAPVASAPLIEPAAGTTSFLTEIQNTAAASPAVSGIDWTGLAITVWLGGAALLFVIQMIRYSDMRDELLTDAEELGDVGGVQLISSDRVAGPLAFGLFRRFIVVPDNFTAHFGDEESALAIEHELSHHKSGDLFVNLIAFAVLCLNWFNPVAWMAWHAFRLDQEAACDARVLSGKDAECRHTYGRTLARATQDGLPTFATALNSPKTVIERLRRLAMNNDSNKRRIAGRLGIFAAIGVALPMTATVVPVWAHPEKAAEAKPANDSKENVQITFLNGKKGKELREAKFHTRKIKKDGKTIIVKSTEPIDDAKIEKMVEEVEAERREVHKAEEKAMKAREKAVEIRIKADKISRRVEKQVQRQVQSQVQRQVQNQVESRIENMRAEIEREVENAVRENVNISVGSALVIEPPIMPAAPVAPPAHREMRVSYSNGASFAVQIAPSSYGFPATEATYSAIRKTHKFGANRREIMLLTLASLRSMRSNFERQCGKKSRQDLEIIASLDREIRHMSKKTKII